MGLDINKYKTQSFIIVENLVDKGMLERIEDDLVENCNVQFKRNIK